MLDRVASACLGVALCASIVVGCQSPAADGGQKMADARASRGRHEKHYVRLPTPAPRREFRQLSSQLAGRSVREVAALLGTPADGFKMGDRESWDYKDAAYDSVTKRTVSNLKIWFNRGVVDDVQASF